MGYKNCSEKESDLEIKCLEGVSRMGGVKNKEVHRRVGIGRELASRVIKEHLDGLYI